MRRPVEQYGGTGRRLERRERRQPFAEPGSAGRERKAARGVRILIAEDETTTIVPKSFAARISPIGAILLEKVGT